jgi:putative NIF3 family GTP cyclohydrolase 1 type 2
LHPEKTEAGHLVFKKTPSTMKIKITTIITEERRQFMAKLGSGIIGAVFLSDAMAYNMNLSGRQNLTVKEIIDIIIADIPGAPFERTVDQLRSGTMDQKVTGIVCTMFPTISVIEQAVQIGANMIVAHETLYYNHQDETDWLEEDEVFQYKKGMLENNQIAIWRFHDYWHRRKPDGIAEGNLRKLGWENYYNPLIPRLLTLPEPQPLKILLAHIKKQFGISKVRLVGDLEQPCQSIYLAFGAIDSKMIIAAIQEYQPNLILSGETREWETVERVRDGLLMGKNTALMVLGHEVSEAAGMAFAAEWIQEKIPDTSVNYIASGDPFQFV